MKYELEKNNNNSKKIIIGIFILFCTVILIVGGTFAFFTESDTKEIDNIVTTDINGTLLYNDDYEENTLYNRQGLIPASLDVVLKSYKRTDTENKCLDMNNYSSCSVYRFSIKNNSNVSQELIMNLNPTANSYNNLKFLLFEIKDNNPEQLSKNPVPLEKGNYSSIQLVDNFTLKQQEERMFELVFYVENQPYAQDDAGKEFGAGISINSVTTGFNVTKQYGTTCWGVDPKDSSKLIAFNGINHDASITDFKESVVESCSGYVDADEEGFMVTIPSKFNNVDIKSLGNKLLMAIGIGENGEPAGINKYVHIKEIVIEEGIEKISPDEVGGLEGTFLGIGGDLANQIADPNKTLKVTLPESLNYIGNLAFMFTALREITIPINVEEIGFSAFVRNTNLTTLNFETIKDDNGNDVSALKTIGDSAFDFCDLTYQDVSKPLLIPASVEYIGAVAFANDDKEDVPINTKLEFIKYTGSHLNNFVSTWYSSRRTTLIEE